MYRSKYVVGIPLVLVPIFQLRTRSAKQHVVRVYIHVCSHNSMPCATAMTTRPDQVPDAQEAVSKLLGNTVICTLDDGRSLEGKFEALDRLKNIILSSVTETRFVPLKEYGAYLEGLDPPVIDASEPDGKDVVDGNGCVVVTRKLSQAFAPGARLAKVEVTQKTWDRTHA